MFMSLMQMARGAGFYPTEGILAAMIGDLKKQISIRTFVLMKCGSITKTEV